MQFPKLSHLQSRFAASLAASLILLLVYLSLAKPQFAYALEPDSRMPPDHNHPIVLDEPFDLDEDGDEPQLVSRAAEGVSALANNAPQNQNIDAGQTQNWVFPKDAVDGAHGEIGPGLPHEDVTDASVAKALQELRKRQTGSLVHLTLNTCLQPTANDAQLQLDATIPPQLQMYISQSSSNPEPGPSFTANQQTINVTGGYAIASFHADSDVYIGISAPNATEFSGIWNYEIAASIDAPFHAFDATQSNLYFVDGDNHAALLITNDTTQALPNQTVYQQWMSMPPPYGLFAHNHDDLTIRGVQNSYCGLQNYARITAHLPGVDNQNIAGMTNRGLGGKPKEQFYITALNASSTYWGFLAMDGNSTASGNGVVGGGGKVWAGINFNTKTESNCALMYNLSFCSEVAYAVPTNPEKFSPITGLPDLASLYDSNAASLYQYFNYSLQQIPCNTSSSSQYSLARNCDDCARAYKQWLCAVTIPRCADFSSDLPWLQPRNTAQAFSNGSLIDTTSPTDQMLLNSVATNSSRNPIIDQNIQPGPYKEVLPCEDLCFDLVQSCPAALGFGCPFPGRGAEESYGRRTSDNGGITCSYLGAAYYLSAASSHFTLRGRVVAVMAGMVSMFLAL